MSRPKQRGVSLTRPRPTDKMLAFAQEFLRNGRRATPAYRTVYNPGTTNDAEVTHRAADILAHPGIAPIIKAANDAAQAEIDHQIAAYALSKGKLALELLHLSMANMLDYVSVDRETGTARLDLSGVTREQMAAVREITVDQVGEQTIVDADGNEQPGPPILRMKLRLHEKGPNIERLAKLMGYVLPDSAPPSSPVNSPNIIFQFVGSPGDTPALANVVVEQPLQPTNPSGGS